MTYATMMVQLKLGQANDELLKVAGSLAERFAARLVGIAACQPTQFIYGDGYLAGETVVACRDELDKEVRDAETEFRAAFATGHEPLEWRSTYTCAPLPDYLAGEARCADLFITSVAKADALDSSRHTNVGDLVMRIGRPTLVVPHSAPSHPFERVVIAWKDTREARRAALDALPLLGAAAHVTVLEIADEGDVPSARGRVDDVVAWLARHDISALAMVSVSTGDDAIRLGNILQEQECDLVVAGAYGHNRLREWAFGGVTRDLLHGRRCALLSH